MPNTLIMRVDSSIDMGTGHVMRCLALAQAWQEVGGSCVFAIRDPQPAIRERLFTEGCKVLPVSSEAGSKEDALELVKLSRSLGADFVVVDGYQFDHRYQTFIKAHGLGLLFIDDNGHAGRYSADIVLNQNAGASADFYRNRSRSTELLLGPKYAMLRRQFYGWKTWKREIAPVGRNVLVTMGGSDPGNVTAVVIRALHGVRSGDVSIKVLIGGSNPHYPKLSFERSSSNPRLEFVSGTIQMAELMAWADLAISAAGSTCWEMCFLGLPAIIIPIAENQRLIADNLDARGAAKQITKSEVEGDVLTERIDRYLLSYGERKKMSSIAQTLVDGEGAARVVHSIREASVCADCHS